jgi:hypothetical protein
LKDGKKMKKIIPLLIVLVISFVMVPEAFSENTEQWELILDSGQGSGNLTLIEKQDGTVTADGDWVYTYQGADVSGPYSDTSVTIVGSSISLTASGTATNPSAPAGYQTSPFTLSITGTAYDGQGSGTFVLTFTTSGWPPNLSGSWEGTRTSGSGITVELANIIEVPLWGTISGFGSGEPYRGQTFKAISGLAEKLSVFLAGADTIGGLNFRVLLTEVDTTSGFRLTNVLFESNILNVPFDRSRKAYTFTVDLGGILLTGRRTYAWVLDAYGLEGGTAPTGICRYDCYADGFQFGILGPFTGSRRDDHFAGPYLVRGSDMAFVLEFTPIPIKDKTMPWLPLLLLDEQ